MSNQFVILMSPPPSLILSAGVRLAFRLTFSATYSPKSSREHVSDHQVMLPPGIPTPYFGSQCRVLGHFGELAPFWVRTFEWFLGKCGFREGKGDKHFAVEPLDLGNRIDKFDEAVNRETANDKFPGRKTASAGEAEARGRIVVLNSSRSSFPTTGSVPDFCARGGMRRRRPSEARDQRPWGAESPFQRLEES